MKVEKNLYYLDYLDYLIGDNTTWKKNCINRLKFDLLLFPEDIICLSVPACVKVDETTKTLMLLTDFWKKGRIKIVIGQKSNYNPFSYFSDRIRKLENSISEEKLLNNFEMVAYTSQRTKDFYNIYIKENIACNEKDLYIPRVYRTDELFRNAVKRQLDDSLDILNSHLTISQLLHLGKVANEVTIMTKNKGELFQRSLVINRLLENTDINSWELALMKCFLDRGFSYANGLSVNAASISLIANKITGVQLMNILYTIDYELYTMICNLSWDKIYILSEEVNWVHFLDQLNKLLIICQKFHKNKMQLFNIKSLSISLETLRLVTKVYESAIESIQKSMLLMGIPLIGNEISQIGDTIFDEYICKKSDYVGLIKELNNTFTTLKHTIANIDRPLKIFTEQIREDGSIMVL